jgi:hypothetical protein
MKPVCTCYNPAVRRWPFVVLALASAPSAPALADHTSWHVLANGEAAATDNVFAAPTGTTREGDLFLTLRPGFLFAWDAPRLQHDLKLELELIEYLAHSGTPSTSLKGGYQALFLPGPRSEALLSLNGQNGLLSAISSRSNPDESVIQVTPINRVDVIQADGSAYASYQASREIRLSETVFGRYSHSDDNALSPPDSEGNIEQDPTIVQSAEVGAVLGFERSFRKNSVSLEAGGSWVRLERHASRFIDESTDPLLELQKSRLDRQLVPRTRAQWRHDFNKVWSGSADGGLAFVFPYGVDPYNPMATDRKNGVFPIAGTQLSYVQPWGRAQLQVRRDITPNLFVAQNTVNDIVIATAAMPMNWLDDSAMRRPKFVLRASAGALRTQLIDTITGDQASSFLVGRIDVGINYTPRPGVVYGARYEVLAQTGNKQAEQIVPGFFRNTLFFTFAIRYPDRVAVEVPQRRSQGAVRADRKDLVPIGVEPVVPDVIEQTDEEGEGEGE